MAKTAMVQVQAQALRAQAYRTQVLQAQAAADLVVPAAPNAAHRHSAIAEAAATVVPLSAEHATEAQAAQAAAPRHSATAQAAQTAARVAAIVEAAETVAAEAEASVADDAKRRKPKQTI